MSRKPKEPANDGKTCGSCKHYEARNESGDETLWGACRRFPPVWFVAEETSLCDFSQTEPSQLCGEWAPNQ
jgi:hypothetical protein